MSVKTIRENELFNNRPFHMFIYNKQVSGTGLHQHDYYEFTLVLTGRYYQEVNGKRVLLERGDLVFIPLGSSHQSFYEFGTTRIFNVGISRSYFDEHFKYLLPEHFVASQAYPLKHEFLSYIESVLVSPGFREEALTEFLEVVTYSVMNRLRHHKDASASEDLPLWLHEAVERMHDRPLFAEDALANLIHLSGKSQEYLTRATRRYYNKTPMQIINEIRINYAKMQLEVTNNSVADIAFETGYNDVSLFIKNFKKLTSFTPGSYRKYLYPKFESPA